jgi:hypothetical protein
MGWVVCLLHVAPDGGGTALPAGAVSWRAVTVEWQKLVFTPAEVAAGDTLAVQRAITARLRIAGWPDEAIVLRAGHALIGVEYYLSPAAAAVMHDLMERWSPVTVERPRALRALRLFGPAVR